MRNRLVERTQYDHTIVADDDMLFHADFYEGLRRFGETYDVMCVRLLNPDGTRFWDWAASGGQEGQSLLDYGASSPSLYVTGGLCIMKAWVSRLVRWDDQRGFYQREDVDFSQRLREARLGVRFNPYCTVTHNDTRYSQLCNIVLRLDELPTAPVAELQRNGIEPHLRVASQHYREGRRHHATLLLERVIGAWGANPEVIRSAAELAARWGDHESAEHFLKRAVVAASQPSSRGGTETLAGRKNPWGTAGFPRSAGTEEGERFAVCNVLFEAACFAGGAFPQEARTAAAKTAAGLAAALLRSRCCRLKLCVVKDRDTLNLLRSFLLHSDQLVGVPLIVGQPGRLLAELQSEFRSRAERRGRSLWREKVVLEVLRALRRMTSRMPSRTLPRADIRWADVMHRTSCDPDPHAPGKLRLVEFQTIHNLASVVSPIVPHDPTAALLRGKLLNPRPNQWFFCPSRSIKNGLCAFASRLDPERIIVARPSVGLAFRRECNPLAVTTACHRLGLAPGEYFVSTEDIEAGGGGRLLLEGLRELITYHHSKAAALVLLRTAQPRLGPLLEAAGVEQQLRPRVRAVGDLSDPDLANLLKGAAGFVALAASEEFPLAVLEAMSCGTPIVASNTEAHAELVGEAGVLVAKNDIRALVEAMTRLLADRAFRQSQGQRALQRAQLFSWERCIQDTLAGYAMALEGRRVTHNRAL
jgi:hypothetical protein